MSGILSTKCIEINRDRQETAIPTHRGKDNSNEISTTSSDKPLYKQTPSISETNLQIPQPYQQQAGLRIAIETLQLIPLMPVRSFATTLTHQITILPRQVRSLHQFLWRHHQLSHFHRIQKIATAMKTGAHLNRLHVVAMALARSGRAIIMLC